MVSLFRYTFIVPSSFSAGVCVFVEEEEGGRGGCNFWKKDVWKKNLREAFALGH